jgi:outer membrane scaffolding protein for murein synthesis (MipA/OmpV family)
LQSVGASEKRVLELGLGMGGASVPHYRGADQRENYILPFPYISYEGKRLKVNREGGQFYFISTPKFRLNLSASFYPPVDSGDNKAREEMPGLDTVFEIGPRAEFIFYESDDGAVQLRMGLPLRQAIATDVRHSSTIGWVFSPYLQWRYSNRWDSSLSVGPMWATEEYHDYFYEVAPGYATADRPRYDAQRGYSGSRITFSLSRRFDNSWAGVFARYDTISGTAFEESPLVKRKDSFIVGVALARILFKWSE